MPSALLESLRPKQWVKNLALFAAIIFSRNLQNITMLWRSILAFVLFCLISSSIYLFNDIRDIESDRQHPVKRKRPLPSGRLSTGMALRTGMALAGCGLISAWFLSPAFFWIALAYFLMQLAYSLKLKQIVILDVMLIALGFVFRVVSGALVIDVKISSWLLICTILLALFLALSKRRHELVFLEDKAGEHRQILREYSPYFLDQMISVVTASTVMAYALYTMSPETVAKFGTNNLDLTIPFVLYGIFRYLYLIHQKELGGDPTRILFTDRPLIINIILWFLCVELVINLG